MYLEDRHATAALGERLYEAVRANPGEGMTVFMAELDRPARDPQRPMMLLKRAGRVRSVGQRHLTRYFPMAKSAQGSGSDEVGFEERRHRRGYQGWDIWALDLAPTSASA